MKKKKEKKSSPSSSGKKKAPVKEKDPTESTHFDEEEEDSQLPVEKRMALGLMRPEDYKDEVEEEAKRPPKRMVGQVPESGKLVRLRTKGSTDSLDAAQLVTPKDKNTKKFSSPASSPAPRQLLGIFLLNFCMYIWMCKSFRYFFVS